MPSAWLTGRLRLTRWKVFWRACCMWSSSGEGEVMNRYVRLGPRTTMHRRRVAWECTWKSAVAPGYQIMAAPWPVCGEGMISSAPACRVWGMWEIFIHQFGRKVSVSQAPYWRVGRRSRSGTGRRSSTVGRQKVSRTVQARSSRSAPRTRAAPTSVVTTDQR